MRAPQLLTAGGHRQSPTAIMQVCVSVRYDTHTTAKLRNRISLCTPLIKRYVTGWGRWHWVGAWQQFWGGKLTGPIFTISLEAWNSI